MMVFLRVHRNQGAFFSSFLLLSAIVGEIIVLVWATTQSDATDSAGIANDESFPTGTTGFAARGEMFLDLPPASRRRLGEGSTRRIPDADDISTTPTFRLALLRPFAPHDAADLAESFVQWNKCRQRRRRVVEGRGGCARGRCSVQFLSRPPTNCREAH